jgi:hypothetical protein
MKRWILAIGMAVAIGLTGCGGGGGNDAQTAARDREKSKDDWKLVLEDAGATTELPIERMDIYLTEEGYPEIYEIAGPGVMLVGEFPRDVRVGYDEEFEKLIGKPVTILASGGDPRELKTSSVTVRGIGAPVVGGSFTVEKVTGKWGGSEGNKTIWGTIEVRIPGADQERTLKGRFAAHAVTWG